MGNLTLNGATSGQITLAPTAVAGTNTLTLPAATGTVLTTAGGQTVSGNTTVSGTVVMGSPFTMRNKIINGAMVIDQRNAGAAVSPAVDGTYYLDRWRASLSVAGKYSIQQNAGSVTPPSGFSNYLGITSLSAYTPAANEIFMLQQRIEGYNTADLAWGTSSALSVTLSFWVRSSLTGTFGGSLTNGTSRSYPFTYTISSANTWEQKTINVAGDTTGTWLTSNGIGVICVFGLGVGSSYSGTAGAWAGSQLFSATGATSVVGTNGATFYITGVQLEIGTAATPFEYRNFQQELAMCQRYYESSYDIGTVPGTVTGGLGEQLSLASAGGQFTFPTRYAVTKRATPTLTAYAGTTGASGNFYNYGGSANVSASFGRNSTTTFSAEKSGFTAGGTVGFYWTSSAEL